MLSNHQQNSWSSHPYPPKLFLYINVAEINSNSFLKRLTFQLYA